MELFSDTAPKELHILVRTFYHRQSAGGTKEQRNKEGKARAIKWMDDRRKVQ